MRITHSLWHGWKQSISALHLLKIDCCEVDTDFSCYVSTIQRSRKFNPWIPTVYNSMLKYIVWYIVFWKVALSSSFFSCLHRWVHKYAINTHIYTKHREFLFLSNSLSRFLFSLFTYTCFKHPKSSDEMEHISKRVIHQNIG